MGIASPVLPGMSWEITRRCKDRMFLLHPDEAITNAFLYCMGYCAEKHSMLLHALTLMDNHYHGNLTDTLGQRVDFVWELHGLVAHCIKHLRGSLGEPMDGPVWNPNESYGRVWIASLEAHIESISYVLANPVAAGLVADPDDWIGFTSRPEDMLNNRQITIKRPACLDDRYPKTATIRFCVPPEVRDNPYRFVEAVERRLDERVDEAKAKFEAQGGAFPTQEELMSVSPFEKPKTKGKRGGIVPRWRAVTREAIRRARRLMRDWHAAYRHAFEAFRAGRFDVEWPAGTWWFARYAGARVAPVPIGFSCAEERGDG